MLVTRARLKNGTVCRHAHFTRIDSSDFDLRRERLDSSLLIRTNATNQMQLRALTNLSLPKLAWVAVVNRSSGIVTLRHGSLVEFRQNFFIEGVWNVPFQSGVLVKPTACSEPVEFSSDESIRFVTSASTTDYLYYAEEGGQVTVSNSLPLLLARIGDALDLRCREYPVICDSILEGINDYRRDIPTKRGKIGV